MIFAIKSVDCYPEMVLVVSSFIELQRNLPLSIEECRILAISTPFCTEMISKEGLNLITK